jgi:hypothetical protein
VPLERYFECLAEWWKHDPRVRCSSGPEKIVNHRAFRAIVAEGRGIMPSILEDYLKDPHAPWDLALEHILKMSPSPEEHRGRPDKIRKDWLAWGRSHGYLA